MVRVAVAMEVEAVEVEGIQMGTKIIPEAIPAASLAKTTPKATPTGMKTSGLDVDESNAKALFFVEPTCQPL